MGLTPVNEPRLVAAAERRRSAGMLAGLLYMLGAVMLVPSTALVDPAPGVEVYLLTLLGVVSGAVCLAAPWDRLRPRALHIVPAIGSLEIGLVILALGDEGRLYTAMLVIVAVWVALVFTDRGVIALHVCFALACGAAAMLLHDATSRQTALHLMVSLPVTAVAAAFVALAREHSDARERAYRRLAERDPLTGVGNYRALRERLDYEVVRHGRHGRGLTVVLIDLDGFKSVNDRHGHLAGDDVLRRVAAEITEAVRGEDTVVRQGGDEFAVLAPELGPDDAPALAERIAARIARVGLADAPVGATVGWACFPTNGIGPDELLAHADADLRRRKGSGVAG